MQPRTIHIQDLPINEIYIDLNDEFRIEIINQAKSKLKGTSKLAKYLKTKAHNIHEWKKGISKWKGKKSRRFLPLNKILKISKLLYNKEELERNIIAIRGPGNGRVIKTRFPWKEDERIIRIVSHIIGDGYGAEFRTGGLPYYRNTSEVLREQFKKDLKFFGTVPTNLNIDMLQFPKVISYILKHLYKIEFDTYNSRVPDILYNLPEKFAGEFLKAFFDDEGSVDSSRVKVTSFNSNLINDIKELIKIKFPKIYNNTTEIRRTKTILNGKLFQGYYFSVLSRGLQEYKNKISFNHTSKKLRLEHALICSKNGSKTKGKNITRSNILETLKEKPQTAYELALKLNITREAISYSINKLKEESLVQEHSKGKYDSIIWSLK